MVMMMMMMITLTRILVKHEVKKTSRIRETPTLSTDADNRTDTNGHRPTASVREAAEYKDDWIARPSPCRSQGQWEVWSEMSRQWRYTQSVTVYRQYMCLAVGSRDLPNLWQCFQTKSVPDCYHICSDCLDQPTFQTLRKKCTNA